MSSGRQNVKAILNSPYFKCALLLPCLVYEVSRERKYYLTHGLGHRCRKTIQLQGQTNDNHTDS